MTSCWPIYFTRLKLDLNEVLKPIPEQLMTELVQACAYLLSDSISESGIYISKLEFDNGQISMRLRDGLDIRPQNHMLKNYPKLELNHIWQI